MKIYFAKYLPVSEEIKEGTQYMDFSGNPKTSGKLYIGQKVLSEKFSSLRTAQSRPDIFKPVKLFLCSRDIQVGDTLRYAMAPENEHPYEEGCKEEGCFKVIGEISPEATWVKEGDEFEEGKIKRDILSEYYSDEDDYTEFCHNHPKGNEKFKIPSDEKYIKEYPIKIKGPCGRFH